MSILLLIYVMTMASPSLRTCAASVTEDGSELERRFREQYPTAFKRLRERYSQAHGVARLTEERVQSGNTSSTKVSTLAFFFDAGYAKLATYRSEASEGDPRSPFVRVSCATPAFGFTAVRQEESSQAVLKKFLASARSDVAEALERRKGDMVSAPFTVWYGTLDQILGSPRNRIVRVDPVTRDGKEFVKVVFTGIISTPKSSLPTNCYAVFSPSDDWALYEFELDTGSAKRTTRVEYRVASDNKLLPQRVIHTSAGTRTTYDFDQFEFGPSPVGEFTFRAAGLPDMSIPGVKAYRNRTAYWLIGGALLAALAAFTLTVLSRRRGARA